MHQRCRAEGFLPFHGGGLAVGVERPLSHRLTGCVLHTAVVQLARSEQTDSSARVDLSDQTGTPASSARSGCAIHGAGSWRAARLCRKSRLLFGFRRFDMLLVCRYLLGLVYPAYVTVNALESPGTQDDHLVRFGGLA